jgi:hypothetical protein
MHEGRRTRTVMLPDLLVGESSWTSSCGSGVHDSDLIGLCPLKTGPIRLGESGPTQALLADHGSLCVHLNELSGVDVHPGRSWRCPKTAVAPRVRPAEIEPASSRVSRWSVLTFQPPGRVMGPRFGLAATTWWPRPRGGARPRWVAELAAATRSGLVRIRCSTSVVGLRKAPDSGFSRESGP